MTSPEFDALSQRYGAAYKWWATAAVMTGCIATVLSSTIVNVAMPDIMGEFGMGQDQVQWLSTAFLAAMTASMLTTDWMLRAFGLRQAYLGAMAAFLAASLVGAASPGVEILVLSRTIQGAAAGLVQPLAMIMVFPSLARKAGAWPWASLAWVWCWLLRLAPRWAVCSSTTIPGGMFFCWGRRSAL